MAIKPKREKATPRQRRKVGIRKKITGTDQHPRLSVFRSSKHIYAQLISDESAKVLAQASTQQKDVLSRVDSVKIEGLESGTKSTKGVLAAKAVGLVLAERAKAANVGSIRFDRNGYWYHGRVQAVADGAREGGLEF